METLPRSNKWKLMTTGGAAKAQVLDSCPLQINHWMHSVNNRTMVQLPLAASQFTSGSRLPCFYSVY